MVDYIFFSILGLGISWSLYRSFLKKEKLFVFNRYFLLCSLCLCLLAPVLQIDYHPGLYTPTNPTAGNFFGSEEIIVEDLEKTNVKTITAPLIDYRDLLKFMYWAVTGLLLLRFSKNILSLFYQINSNRYYLLKELKTVSLKERGNPYSFFNYLFIHPKDLLDYKHRDLVLLHERAHSQQLHSADIILMEILGCFFWYNPFLWFYKREIVENHEFLADEAVIKSGANRDDYSAQIIKPGGKVVQPLLSGFSFIQTKNRLDMLHTKRSSKIRIALKTGLALLLFAAVFAISSFSTNSNTAPLVVVVDAGHGGKDPGNTGDGLSEKEINLAIANQLKAIGNGKQVKIILLREKDNFLSLDDRVNFLNGLEADLFLSLHCNAAGNSERSGADFFYSTENIKGITSKDYSSLLATGMVPTVGKAEIKEANFIVIKNSKIPAVLIHVGYMTNPREYELLQDPAHQKQLAEGIFNGLLAIKNSAGK